MVLVVAVLVVAVLVLVDVVDGCDSGCGNTVAVVLVLVVDIRGRFRVFG